MYKYLDQGKRLHIPSDTSWIQIRDKPYLEEEILSSGYQLWSNLRSYCRNIFTFLANDQFFLSELGKTLKNGDEYSS